MAQDDTPSAIADLIDRADAGDRDALAAVAAHVTRELAAIGYGGSPGGAWLTGLLWRLTRTDSRAGDVLAPRNHPGPPAKRSDRFEEARGRVFAARRQGLRGDAVWSRVAGEMGVSAGSVRRYFYARRRRQDDT